MTAAGLHMVTAMLAPLLLLQALRVRGQVPRLPEPSGEREGRAGSGEPLRLLILGDSAAAGVGANSQVDALSGQLAQRLAPHVALSWRLLAHSGDRSRGVLQRLPDIGAEKFDVALLSIGVNDVTALASPSAFAADAGALLDRLRRQHDVRLLLLSGLPPMGDFPALPQPLRWRLGAQARRLDQRLIGIANDSRDCIHLPFGPLPDASLMASDGFHPGPAAYALWAQAASEAILANRALLTSET